MGAIAIEPALRRLQIAFDALLEERMPQYRGALEIALADLHLRRESKPLVESFSPLVALYPTLVAEGLGEVEAAIVERANLAHLLLILHAFLDDRLLDGELESPRRETLLFSRRLFLLATTLLRDALGKRRRIDALLEAREREYLAGQLLAFRAPGGAPREWEEVRTIVAARAALGSVAWEALAIHADLAEDSHLRLKAAYDALAVGMQWEDDLVDWKVDLARGAENLVLTQMPGVAAEALRLRPPGSVALDSTTLRRSFAMLSREWRQAIEVVEQQGCRVLLQQTAARFSRIQELGPAHW